jgi:hypothetical protein
MSKIKKVFNKVESEKAALLKGSVRSVVKLSAIQTCRSQTHVNRKKLAISGGKNKHRTHNYGF